MNNEILFGIGGGILSYQLGIVKFITENCDLKNLRNNYYFGGASAGAISSLVLCCVVHNIYSVDYWFNNIYLDFLQKITQSKSGAWFKIDKIIPKVIEKSYFIIKSKQKSISFLNNRYHLSVTEFPSFQKKIIDNFSDCNQLIKWIMISCNAPLLNKKLSVNLEGKNYGDGIFNNQVPNRFENSQKTYFTIIEQSKNNCETINIKKWGNLSYLDIWIWGDINHAKKLYFQGYQDAVKYKNLILSKINNLKIKIFYEKLLNSKKKTH